MDNLEAADSIRNVVFLVFNQCKEDDVDTIKCHRIISYLKSSFDINSDEANKLKLNELFQLIEAEGLKHDNNLNEEQFEDILKLWIPNVRTARSLDLESDAYMESTEPVINDNSFNTLRLQVSSKSLTNICHSSEFSKLSKVRRSNSEILIQNIKDLDQWCSTNSSPSYNENLLADENQETDVLYQTPSPDSDPFQYSIGHLDWPNNRQRILSSRKRFRQIYCGADELVDTLKNPSCIAGDVVGAANILGDKVISEEEFCTDNTDSVQMAEGNLKLTKSSEDILTHLKRIKFENNYLDKINNQLQQQLENVEEKLKEYTAKCVDLEKKNKSISYICRDYDQLRLEFSDIENALTEEKKKQKMLLSEKILLEAELTSMKEYCQTVVDKLTVLDDEIEGKVQMIKHLEMVILKHEEANEKLKMLNEDREQQIIENMQLMKELNDSVENSQLQIKALMKEKNEIEEKYRRTSIQLDDSFMAEVEINPLSPNVQDRGCLPGRPLPINRPPLRLAEGQFLGKCVNNEEINQTSNSMTQIHSPWSINVELASSLFQQVGDSPFCEKSFFDCNEEFLQDESLSSSFKMLSSLLGSINDVRCLLLTYRVKLEETKANISQNNEIELDDEVSLVYLTCLNNSLNLVSASAEKAVKCQNQFNSLFERLVNRINDLSKGKIELEKKLDEMKENVGAEGDNVKGQRSEEMLERELRKERLAGIEKQFLIDCLKKDNSQIINSSECSHCKRPFFQSHPVYRTKKRRLDALDLARETVGALSDDATDEDNQSNNEPKFKYFSRRRLRNERRRKQEKENIYENQQVDNDQPQQTETEDSVTNPDDKTEYSSEEMADAERNYYISTDDLINQPRFRISRVENQCSDTELTFDENSWLENPKLMAERRTSVFVHNIDETADGELLIQTDVGNNTCNGTRTDTNSNAALITGQDSHEDSQKQHYQEVEQHRLSSSCSSLSSSGDAAETNLKNLGVNRELEQVRLAQELRVRQGSLTTRSTNLLNIDGSHSGCTSPCMGSSIGGVTVTLSDDFSKTESEVTLKPNQIPTKETESQATDLEVVSNVGMWMDANKTTQTQPEQNKTHNIQISIQDVTDVNKETLLTPSEEVFESVQDCDIEKPGKRKRERRPNTVSGIGSRTLMPQECEEIDESANKELAQIQEMITAIEELRSLLTQMSPSDLENRFHEVSVQYSTDREFVDKRARDAGSKCGTALANVEQEFSILRRLVREVTSTLSFDCSNDLLPRIKASINVLEKCVEYLSAKSETLGSIEKEIRMCKITDVMFEFSSKLLLQNEKLNMELEESKKFRDNFSSTSSSNKKSISPKKRFQEAAHVTVAKSAVVRKLANSSVSQFGNTYRKLHSEAYSSNRQSTAILDTDEINDIVDINDGSSAISRSASTATSNNTFIINNNVNISNNSGSSPTSRHFFPQSDTSVFSNTLTNATNTGGFSRMSTRESLALQSGSFSTNEVASSSFQKGLQRGLKLSADQALNELRDQQSRFSYKLDQFCELLEDPYETNTFQNNDSSPLFSMSITSLVARITRWWTSRNLFDISEMWIRTRNNVTKFRHEVTMVFRRLLHLIIGSLIILAFLLPWFLSSFSSESRLDEDSSLSGPTSMRNSRLGSNDDSNLVYGDAGLSAPTPTTTAPTSTSSPPFYISNAASTSTLMSSLHLTRNGPNTV